jgi:DNA polymerase-3 subunit epsilon
VYLELLAEVLEDGVLTDAEASALVDVAKLYALTREQVLAAHRGFLLALAHKVVEDGKVTRDEREDLLAAASVLGFPGGLIKAVLNEARSALLAQRSQICRPLPSGWQHGEPLCVGQAVAFTGCDELQRARLEGQSQAAGVRVTGSVSRKTVALVTDGADPHTTKAIAARQYGTRIVTPVIFAEMVRYIQPSLSELPEAAPVVAPQRTSNLPAHATRVPHGTNPDPGDPDPAVIRAWAREHGFAVGIRGRLPADVCAAYRAAHGLP